jgi:L-fucose isomerase-like protein
MNVPNRRDSWCGKISVSNNLYQYGIKYSLTNQHVSLPSDAIFQKDLLDFVAVCKVAKGLKKNTMLMYQLWEQRIYQG